MCIAGGARDSIIYCILTNTISVLGYSTLDTADCALSLVSNFVTALDVRFTFSPLPGLPIERKCRDLVMIYTRSLL